MGGSLVREAPTPAPGPSCAGSGFCEFVYHQTGLTWLAESSYWVLVKPLTILLILVLALVVRFLLHRTIDKLIKHTLADDDEPEATPETTNGFSLLRPLRN